FLNAQFYREAVGVVEFEDRLAVQLAILRKLFEFMKTLAKSLAKYFFLAHERLNNLFAVCGHFWVILVVHIGNDWHDLLEEVLLDTQIKSETNRSAQEASHDVALFFIAWADTINRQESCTTEMVGNYTHSV